MTANSMEYNKCFICFTDTRKGQGLQLSSDEASSFILYNVLELPHWNSAEKKQKIRGVTYCQPCSNKMTEMREMLDDLEDLEDKILSTKNEVESKLKESWKMSKQCRPLATLDPVDQFRDEVVSELKSSKILSMLTKMKEKQLTKKFRRPNNMVHLDFSQTESETISNHPSGTQSHSEPISLPILPTLKPNVKTGTTRTRGNLRIAKGVTIPNVPLRNHVLRKLQRNSTTVERHNNFELSVENHHNYHGSQIQLPPTTSISEEILLPDSSFSTSTHGGYLGNNTALSDVGFEPHGHEEVEYDPLFPDTVSDNQTSYLDPLLHDVRHIDHMPTANSDINLSEPTSEILVEHKIIPSLFEEETTLILGHTENDNLPPSIQCPSTSGSTLTVSACRLKSSNRPHTKKTINKRSFVCGTCGMNFSRYHELKAHDDKVHTSRQKSHPATAATTKFNPAASQRIRIKSRPSTCWCDECGKGFTQTANLKYHVMKQHRGMSKIQCPLCGFGLMCESHLRAHIASRHTKERNFKCHVCSASYKNQRVLNIHMRNHTGEKPYQCKLCPERFIDSTFLRRHERVRHGEPVSCHICHRKYKDKKSLSKHILTHLEYEHGGHQGRTMATVGRRGRRAPE